MYFKDLPHLFYVVIFYFHTSFPFLFVTPFLSSCAGNSIYFYGIISSISIRLMNLSSHILFIVQTTVCSRGNTL